VLLDLEIIPLINASHEVTLQNPPDQQYAGQQLNISGNEIPEINTQEINTQINRPNKRRSSSAD